MDNLTREQLLDLIAEHMAPQDVIVLTNEDKLKEYVRENIKIHYDYDNEYYCYSMFSAPIIMCSLNHLNSHAVIFFAKTNLDEIIFVDKEKFSRYCKWKEEMLMLKEALGIANNFPYKEMSNFLIADDAFKKFINYKKLQSMS